MSWCSRVAMTGVLLCAAMQGRAAGAATIELRDATVVYPTSFSKQELNAVRMLVDEVEKRTTVRWATANKRPAKGDAPTIELSRSAQGTQGGAAPGREGYRIAVGVSAGAPAVRVETSDARGILYGCGRLLRELRMSAGSIRLPDDTQIVTSPAIELRGHQLGYRPKTNSYDAWTPVIWEQYIRDLIVFGVNAIELIPPRSDDAPRSPHFPLSQIEMMTRMSQIADDYGIDVWIWYPAMDRDYSNAETVSKALKEWGEVFAKLPRIDAVFVPGGDPGHTEPKHLLELLEKQTQVLHKSHPKAQMWVSPQSFTQEWMDQFLGIAQKDEPAWLSGVVFGPQNRLSLQALRKQLPAQYPIRLYPDITHSLRSQYVVEDWDLAYAITEDREVINPRPLAEADIFRATKDDTIGFITYSEGCNDDVNKIVWSALGWDPNVDVHDIVHQYARYFIGERLENDFALGLLALERNWRGPLLENDTVDHTLQHFQTLEQNAAPQDLLNWRFQQALFGAHYDAYTRQRLIHETALEAEAMTSLGEASTTSSSAAIASALEVLARANSEPVATELRARCFALAEALYQSIRMQLSVPLYKAIDVGRGAHLDLIDRPLNNRQWLESQLGALEALPEAEQLAGIAGIVNWTNAGPGGFYDDLGDIGMQPHLVRGPGRSQIRSTGNRAGSASRFGLDFGCRGMISPNRFSTRRCN